MSNLVGQGPFGLPGGTSVVYTTPFPVVPGSRARDNSGNEYIFCSFGEVVNGAQLVQIDAAFDAIPTGMTGRGPCGVACYRGTSDQGGWVQIYGRCYMQIADGAQTGSVSPSNGTGLTSAATSIPTVFHLPTTGITSPAAPVWLDHSTDPSLAEGHYIDGINVATDASIDGTVSLVSATTDSSASAEYKAHTGAMVAVWLNYPNIVYRNMGA